MHGERAGTFMSKHTKGPWEIGVAEHTKDGFTLYAQSGVKSGEQWANARLIARAPELLSLLQEAAREFQPGDTVSTSWLEKVNKLVTQIGGQDK